MKTEITIRRVTDSVELACLNPGDWCVFETTGEGRKLGQVIEFTPRGVAVYFPDLTTIVHKTGTAPVYRVRSITAEY